MKSIDRLSDREVLALARFIEGCARARHSTHWRQHFSECVKRNSFVPFATLTQHQELRALLARHSLGVVISLRTADIVTAASEVAAEWGEPPLVLEAPAQIEAAGSS
jgi:hypothetical protein